MVFVPTQRLFRERDERSSPYVETVSVFKRALTLSHFKSDSPTFGECG